MSENPLWWKSHQTPFKQTQPAALYQWSLWTRHSELKNFYKLSQPTAAVSLHLDSAHSVFVPSGRSAIAWFQFFMVLEYSSTTAVSASYTILPWVNGILCFVRMRTTLKLCLHHNVEFFLISLVNDQQQQVSLAGSPFWSVACSMEVNLMQSYQWLECGGAPRYFF